MKKLYTIPSMSLIAVLIAAPIFSESVSADTTATSENTVTFNAPSADTTPPDVVNPTDPTEPPSVIPSKPGAQAVDFASAIDFGAHTLDGATTTFTGAVKSGTTGDAGTPILAWHDLDGASPKVSYKITAALTKAFDMAGATVTYGAGTIVNSSGAGVTATTGVETSGDITLGEDGTAQTVITGTGELDGHFVDEFSGVSLYVPVASQTAGVHSATVTWTMTNAVS
ncbi:WxL domain-containing protein [Lactococcus lactis]|uniref:WxL domain-containing protein n=1 Tax=Lactococcus lactis TaxID=1358 RepID=UPI002415F948|nr:WxL domain-containing protein [Lactococcus lactis]MDG4960591.1 WxL domain-containing protein [Lactococcus lactis]